MSGAATSTTPGTHASPLAHVTAPSGGGAVAPPATDQNARSHSVLWMTTGIGAAIGGLVAVLGFSEVPAGQVISAMPILLAAGGSMAALLTLNFLFDEES